MTAAALRALLASDHVTHVPGVWDPISAALAVRAGHRVVHLSGAAVSAIALADPDPDRVHGTQIADRASTLGPALGAVPLLADAGTGYDDPVHAVWTGLAYARAGISGLRLPDRAGGTAALGPAVAKISALAGQVPELALIAQTDAYAGHGLAEVIVRCRAFAQAGADAVLPEGVRSPEELAELHRALPGVPIVISHAEGGPSDAELARAGVAMVLHPLSALLAAVRAASLAYRATAEHGSAEPVDRMPWASFTSLAEPQASTGPDVRYVPGGVQT